VDKRSVEAFRFPVILLDDLARKIHRGLAGVAQAVDSA